jgi:hypothetical protein
VVAATRYRFRLPPSLSSYPNRPVTPTVPSPYKLMEPYIVIRENEGESNAAVITDFIKTLAKIPGVSRDSIRNEGTREINYGIK